MKQFLISLALQYPHNTASVLWWDNVKKKTSLWPPLNIVICHRRFGEGLVDIRIFTAHTCWLGLIGDTVLKIRQFDFTLSWCCTRFQGPVYLKISEDHQLQIILLGNICEWSIVYKVLQRSLRLQRILLKHMNIVKCCSLFSVFVGEFTYSWRFLYL